MGFGCAPSTFARPKAAIRLRRSTQFTWDSEPSESGCRVNPSVCHPRHLETPRELEDAISATEAAREGARKWTNGVSTNWVTANVMFFDRGTFWVPPLTYFIFPKVPGRAFFPQSVKINHICSGPISSGPMCPQPRRTPGGAALRLHLSVQPGRCRPPQAPGGAPGSSGELQLHS